MSKLSFAHEVNKTDLLRVPIPVQTASYAPVSHKKIIEITLEELEKNGLQVLSS